MNSVEILYIDLEESLECSVAISSMDDSFCIEQDTISKSDLVCDILNKDYYNLVEDGSIYKSPRVEYVTSLGSKRAEDHREIYRKLLIGELEYSQIYRNNKGYHWYKDALSKINLPALRKMVDFTFVDCKYTLSYKHKYLAYLSACYSGAIPDNLHYKIEETTGETCYSLDADNLNRRNFNYREINKESGQYAGRTYSYFCEMFERENVRVYYEFCYRFYDIKSWIDTMISEIISDENYDIKKCAHCGRYFSPRGRESRQYCLRPSPETCEKNCHEYIKYMNYLKRNQSNEAVKLYRQIYNNQNNKIRRSNNEKLREQLNHFMNESKQWKLMVENGTKTEDEYITWLKTVKEKKVL